MPSNNIRISINSEVGQLENVIMHTPGIELENMTPEYAQKALYNDILNLNVAKREHSVYQNVISKVANVFEIEDLLLEAFNNGDNRGDFLKKIAEKEHITPDVMDYLNSLSNSDLCSAIIKGVELKKDTLTKFLDNDPYEIGPLHNLFFTRDISIGINNSIFISRMASNVRNREAIIMEHIFKFHPNIATDVVTSPKIDKNNNNKPISFEGGDFLIAREDILLVGTGERTTTTGIDFVLNYLKNNRQKGHIIVQELPHTPASFIHLDMVFTFINTHQCMVYKPLIMLPNRYLTIHIQYENGKVTSINEVDNIPAVLKSLGMDLDILYCGGGKELLEEREQWHSGANFFALAPGKILGYGRNIHTIEELNKKGYEVLTADEVINKNINIYDYKQCVITINGAELSRGGGGCRCMTLPLTRKPL